MSFLSYRSVRLTLACLLALSAALAPTRVGAQTDSAAAAAGPHAGLLGMIDRFLADPAAGGERVGLALMDSAQKIDDVTVSIAKDVVPWLDAGNLDVRPKRILLGAFLAGNMRAQITKGVVADQPLAGVIAVIDVYQRLVAGGERMKIGEVEKWAKLRAEGKLEEYVAKMVAKR